MNILLMEVTSGFDSFLKLLSLLVVFVLILFAAYYTTKWLSKTGLAQVRNKNIKVIETYRIAQNKFVQIIKVGDKYIAIGVGKDQIEMLTTLNEEDLDLTPVVRESPNVTFKDVLSNMGVKQKNIKKGK